jgi:hypothetical protein
MAGESKRLLVLKALSAHLESEISIANGYKHDLAGAVYRGRLFFDGFDALPCISILESPNPDRFPNRAGDQDNVRAVQKDLWTLELQGWALDDKRHPTDPAYDLMADVKKALAKIVRVDPNSGDGYYPAVYRLGNLIVDLKWEPGTVRPPEEHSSKAFFYMRVIVTITEDFHDPYLV